jgi:hypothetical protein
MHTRRVFLWHAEFLNGLTAYIRRSNDVFIKHFYDTYSDTWPPSLPLPPGCLQLNISQVLGEAKNKA